MIRGIKTSKKGLRFKRISLPEIDKNFSKRVKQSAQEYESITLKGVKQSLKDRLVMSSIEGNAHEGHRGFLDREKRIAWTYPNATFDDVVIALGRDPDEVKNYTQGIIDEIETYLGYVVDSMKKIRGGKRIKIKGYKPHNALFEIRSSKKLKGQMNFDQAKQYLQGFFLGSVMDSAKWRENVEQFYDDVYMHKGVTAAVDLEKLRDADLTINDLSSSAYKDKFQDLPALIRAGIVIAKPEIKASNTMMNAYIEQSKGSGTSDDMSMIFVDHIKGKEAPRGLFSADQVDTLDKGTAKIVFGGQDEAIGAKMKEYYEDVMNEPLGVYPPVIRALILVSRAQRGALPSSSQSYFLKEQPNGMSVLEMHLKYIDSARNTGKYTNPKSAPIGFEQVHSDTFYKHVRERLKEGVQNNILEDTHGLNSKNKKVEIKDKKGPLLKVA